ncbi:MAG: hypothetical protein AAF805_05220 [Planctomycetota bacterium]
MRALSLVLALLSAAVARGSEPYATGPASVAANAGPAEADPFAPTPSPDAVAIDVEHGERRPVIDGVGWVLGAPNKLLLLDSRVDNHDVSPETVERTVGFLAENDVDGVMVRVNQHDPLGEWRRLAENDRVGLGWRATVGAVYTLGYSLIPGRLIGGDWYNPFTDTVHVYSDVPALAMEQAAQALDTRTKSHPGFYSATRLLPLVGIVHEARAKQAVFEHIDEHGDSAERAEARRVLHPQMGREVGGQAAIFVPQADAIVSLGGAAVGHVVGRLEANRIEAADPPPTASGPADTPAPRRLPPELTPVEPIPLAPALPTQ